MEEALVAHLLADAGLTALVTDRVDWLVRPQGAGLPAVTLTGVSGVRDYHSAGPSGLVASRVQIDVWAATFAGALAVARAVEASLSGLRARVGQTSFQGCFLENERQSFEEGTGGAHLRRVSLDFTIHHRKVQDDG